MEHPLGGSVCETDSILSPYGWGEGRTGVEALLLSNTSC